VDREFAGIVWDIKLQAERSQLAGYRYAFLRNDGINDVDPRGLEGTDKDDKCCTDAAKKAADAALNAAISALKKISSPEAKALLVMLSAAKTSGKLCSSDFGPCAALGTSTGATVENCTSCCLAISPTPLAGAACDKICIAIGFP